ncbi:MAG: hypothetical protein EI684_05195 [Candidatus Viridilinea halotolerans]|uniref:Pappalysin-1 SD scarf domain-containing protein n=1 Tax=Candidatus Viridilinea halotolerans TaxID=2491704 RepID=A0A426U5R7_9CHLR|nr:MAG: hypothetical protein EI684_05195 [Candidatus Viridilinea halotolerans]
MRRLLLLLLVVLMGGCALPWASEPTPTLAPTPTVVPTATPLPSLSETLAVEELGFTVSLPSGWAHRLQAELLMIAPTETDLQLDVPGDGLVLLIDATPLSSLVAQLGAEAASDPQAFLALSRAPIEAANYVLSATTTLTQDGHNGLVADLSGPQIGGRLAIILGPEMALRVLGQASAEAWEGQAELYDALLASLRFMPLPAPTPTPTPVQQASQPLVVDAGPPGFVLRLGGRAGPPDGRFVAARGLAVAPDGTLYLAESRRGVWVFAPDGTFLKSFGGDEVLDAYDVALAPDGEVFVADFGRNAIAHFSADGEFIDRWGSTGDGLAQFGLTSPQRIALGPDGSIYALDTRPGSESGRLVSSVVRFSRDGELLERITLPEEVAPTDIVVAPDGSIFLAKTLDGAIKLAPDGTELARFGDPIAPQALAAAALDLDSQGNIYLATYSAGIVKLNANGQVVASGGAATIPGALPAPGEFNLPNGIVVAPGGIVWVSDNSGEYSAVTALRLQASANGGAENGAEAEAEDGEAEDATPSPTPTIVAATLVRQWAREANASSFYAPDYAPSQATGAPDVEGCQDSTNAWAAAEPNSLEILELRYATPVFAVGVVVHQSYNPGFISKIELFDERGTVSEVYSAEPQRSEQCPVALEVNFAQTLNRIVAVRLTVDQRPGANWSEIDAVELVGVP